MIETAILPSIRHNTADPTGDAVVDDAVLQWTAAIRHGSSQALAVEQEGRTRRDDVLTSAVLGMAELMAGAFTAPRSG